MAGVQGLKGGADPSTPFRFVVFTVQWCRRTGRRAVTELRHITHDHRFGAGRQRSALLIELLCRLGAKRANERLGWAMGPRRWSHSRSLGNGRSKGGGEHPRVGDSRLFEGRQELVGRNARIFRTSAWQQLRRRDDDPGRRLARETLYARVRTRV